MFNQLGSMLKTLSPAQVRWFECGVWLIAIAVAILLLYLFKWLFNHHPIILIFSLLFCSLALFILALTPLPDLIWFVYQDMVHLLALARS